MRRLGEPEVDSWWLVSAAPPDHKLLPFLHFPWEFRVSEMWNDGVFPPFFSSPLTTNFAGNSESRIPSSNTFTELERQTFLVIWSLHCSSCNSFSVDIFTTPQDSDCFQLGSFLPPLSPASGLSATPLNSNPVLNGAGEGDVLTATAATNLRPSAMTLIQPNGVAGCNKRVASIDSPSKRAISTRASKRPKTAEKLHQPPCNESTSTHPQLMKAPARRSQKLGDKITALQQLVSPFGKTDTASVLHEATICIKFLHEQIQVLTAPYFRFKSSPHLPGHGEEETSLQSRGLCLAPISSTIISLINQPASNSHSPKRKAMATGASFY